jgi:hypothetical protein
METWQIGANTLEYDDDTHTYIVDGVIVPSVTQILGVKFGNKYAGVNRSTLERAANRGTAIHKAIENFCKYGEDDGAKEVHNFNFLKKRYGFNVLENETPIIISKDDTPIAAGRLDLILDIKGDTAIADIKTTSVLDKEYLAYQLNLYRIGYMQSYGRNVSELYGVHLREDKRKLINIPVNEGIAWDIIDQYERSKNNE